MDPRYVDDGDSILDPSGQKWLYLTGWLEPDEVRNLVKRGAVVAVHECAGWEWDVKLSDDVMRHVVTSETSHKYARGKYPEKVIFVPTLWQNESTKSRLIVLAEEAPMRRKVIEELREPYEP